MSDGAFHTTRREFLAGSLTLLGAASTLPLFSGRAAKALVGTELPRARRRNDHRILVVVQLAGGNDGLNTVIPYDLDLYYRFRPQLGIPKKDVLPLQSGLGLHPAATGLKALYDAGHLAIVQGVGYPGFSRSHFTSMDVWQTADPELKGHAGWLGRYSDATGAGAGPDPQPTQAVALTSEAPLALRGARFMPLAVDDPGALTWRAPACAPFSGQLQTVARMIAADQPTRVYFVSLAGFDTHSAQLGRHQQLLRQLGDALEHFVDTLKADGLLDRVLLMTFSEFGRRVQENANGGTDHGEAAPLFLCGSKLHAGLHGPHPDLGKLKRGGLPFACDFRRVYAAVLRDWLDMRPENVLGPGFEPLKLIRT